MDEMKLSNPAKVPETPKRSTGEWVKKNLFSNVPNTVLTIVFGFLALYSIKGLLGFILSGERRWAAVATNMRLLMAQGYPANQFIRVWFTLGCLMVLTGVSLAIWRSNGVLKTKRIGTWVLNLGVGAAIFALLAPISANARGGWLIAVSYTHLTLPTILLV